VARKFWQKRAHQVPDPSCTCGMYAGINMQHMIDIGYIGRGIHGEVSLWGRLYRHTLGWRAQYAYPNFFVVPANMVPFDMTLAQRCLAMLVEFEVDIYLQPDREAKVGGERIPLWIKGFGYSQQGLSWLIEKRKQWYTRKSNRTLGKGDRIAVLSDVNGGDIGVVTEIDGGEMYYTLFHPNVVYRKKLKDVVWNERNWRWETSGLGSMRKLGLGGDWFWSTSSATTPGGGACCDDQVAKGDAAAQHLAGAADDLLPGDLPHARCSSRSSPSADLLLVRSLERRLLGFSLQSMEQRHEVAADGSAPRLA